MSDLNNFSIKVKNFKCFGDEPSGFECIKPINLIIGRNNSGKSTLLDLIEYATQQKIETLPRHLWNTNKMPEFIGQIALSKTDIQRVFNTHTSAGGIPGSNHWEFGRRLIGAVITWKINIKSGQKFVALSASPDGSQPIEEIRSDYQNGYCQRIADVVENPLTGKLFRRLQAERNIMPELDSPLNLDIQGDGIGATNLIQNFLNKAALPSELVEVTLLESLNQIFNPDAYFNRIMCQQLPDDKWEIYLEEESKGRIPLSQSGSGLKTVILVLAYIHLIPVVKEKKLADFIFGFEELENNLHPSLLRRLLKYIKEHANNSGCIFLLTTHSNVAIDLLNKDQIAQILHVTHNKTIASVKRVGSYIENKGILDDLDVRASDLLQSNCIIWVEGPSDRIYLNRWISIWTNGELVEGYHYQCVFYGGRLIAHLSSEDPDVIEEGLSILRVNRNAIILIDSDKRNKQAPVNETKKRMQSEVEGNSGIAWITKGREIENYISRNVIAKWLDVDVTNLKQSDIYEDFFAYLDHIEQGKGKYKTKKPLLAERLTPYFEKNDLENVLDLSSKIDELCEKIKHYNKL